MGHPNRTQQRNKKKQKTKEESLEIRNPSHAVDLTPKIAVDRIRKK